MSFLKMGKKKFRAQLPDSIFSFFLQLSENMQMGIVGEASSLIT